MRAKIAAAMVVASGCWMSAGCNLVLGLDDPTPAGAGGTATTGGAAGSGATTGAGGGGGATGTVCIPGATQPCKYSGDPATENVGACHAGAQTCNAEGTGYGACTGEVVPVKEICGNQEDEDCDGVSCGGTIWSKLWGDAGDQTVDAMGVTGADRVTFQGHFEGSLAVGDTPIVSASSSIYVASIEGNGSSGWAKDFPQAKFVTVDPKGRVIAVSKPNAVQFQFDRFDETGSIQWSQSMAAGMGFALDTASFDSLNGPLLLGRLFTSATFGPKTLNANGATDGLILRLNSNTGALESASQFGGSGDTYIGNVALDPQDNIFTSGIYDGPLLFPADPVGSPDAFVVRLSPNGTPSWGVPVPGTVFGSSIATDSSGAVVIAGRFANSISIKNKQLDASGPADVFIGRLSAAGDVAWAQAFGGPSFVPTISDGTETVKVATDTKGNVLLAVVAQGTIDFGGGLLGKASTPMVFLAKLGQDGTHVWSRAFGPVSEKTLCVVGAGANDEPILGCTLEATTVDFGNGPLTGKGGLDVVVARFAP